MDFHEHLGCFFPSETQPVIVQGDDARLARLQHPHLRARPQTHFPQPRYERFLTAHLGDGTRFASVQKIQGNDVVHANFRRRALRRDKLFHKWKDETKSQLAPHYSGLCRCLTTPRNDVDIRQKDC